MKKALKENKYWNDTYGEEPYYDLRDSLTDIYREVNREISRLRDMLEWIETDHEENGTSESEFDRNVEGAYNSLHDALEYLVNIIGSRVGRPYSSMDGGVTN